MSGSRLLTERVKNIVLLPIAPCLFSSCAELLQSHGLSKATFRGYRPTIAEQLAPDLVALPGCGPLTAAKIIGETAGIDRFKSRDAYARYNGTAPLPVWSANKARHRLSRTGNRQLNAALHRIGLTQARWRPSAQAMIQRRRSTGDSGHEAIRILKRRLSDAVFQAHRTDQRELTTLAA